MVPYIIYTNNPAVRDRYASLVRFIGGDASAVFTAVRDAVHLGARIISHPLSGSVKPWESPYKSPYKSVAVSLPAGSADNRSAVDFQSLRVIEDAMRFPSEIRGVFNTDESTREDYRIIDLDLITNALEGNICPTSTIS
ncbi:MAG: GrdX family protein [Defluviitaleaceae bacterium]|nr:GrdX family protein [Defluviitaleaceae bacterium]